MKVTDKFKLESATIQKARTPLIALAVVGWLVSLAGFAINRDQFYFSYLVSFVYVLSICLGALFFVMIQYVTTSGWSVTVRRLAETVMVNVDILAVLFIPVAIGIPTLFHWSHPEVVNKDLLLQKKAGYLNTTFFIVRAVIYFLVWILLTKQIYGNSVSQDQNGNPSHTQTNAKWSAPGILLLFITGSFAAFDWLMSLDPHWYSTIFGIYFFSGGGVSFVALLIVIAILLRRSGYLEKAITVEHYHDLGKLLFAFTVFWTYIAFSQYFLIWYANIPEETIWYIHRFEGSWKAVSVFLPLGHFLFPFFALISRTAKRHLVFLPAMALWILFAHYVDIYWMVMPTHAHHGPNIKFLFLDLATLAAVVGTVGFVFVSRLGKNAIVPVRDPFLEESLKFENV
ncbi:MAG: hypothetical protein JNN15_02625 [Blastocatellia bacterium]|nr:hypothetical protein [Blastocatellia bacterium]